MVETESKTGNRQGGSGNRNQSLYLKIGKYAAAGLEFPSTVLGGILLGYLLDNYFNTSPWFTTILTLVALVGAFVRLFQWVSYFSREKK
jgi:F0F1-type ATP synthase assembly protein I